MSSEDKAVPLRVAVCVIVRNEAAYLAEWIAYQTAVGFDAVLVYDNNSTDGTAAVAESLAGVVDVRVTPWTETVEGWQRSAYDHAVATVGVEFDWIAFFDADEFFTPVADGHVHRFVERFEPTIGAVGVPQCFYSSSGWEERPTGLTVELFRWRPPDDFGPNLHIKSFIRPELSAGFINPHATRLRDGASYTGADGAPIEFHSGLPGVAMRFQDLGLARVNHYFIRSREDWRVKVARGYNGHEQRTMEQFADYDVSAVEDASACRYADATRALLVAAGLDVPPSHSR